VPTYSPRRRNALEPLLEAAQHYPDAPALHHREETWTYAQLSSVVDRLATGLTERTGFAAGDRVGVLSHKSLHSVAAMQAILRADGVYVMLDARQPPSRLAALCQDCDIKVLFGDETVSHHANELRAVGCDSFILMDTVNPSDLPEDFHLARQWPNTRREPNPAGRGGEDLAALLYTSGSTGMPKAVQITHENITSFVEWADDAFEFSSDEVFLNQAHLSFDISTLDLYNAFHAGASVVLLDETDAIFPRAVTSLLQERKITNIYMVSSALASLMDRGGLLDTEPTTIRRILYGGEVLPRPALARLRSWLPPKVPLLNVYGPIETNICSIWSVLGRDTPPDPTAIGYPVSPLDMNVRRVDGTACAPGEVGEIWVTGPTVSPGYWRRPELDAAKFVTEGRTRWYRTGDLGAVDATGVFSFHGRADHLVKRRGYRIELGEIEAAIFGHPNIAECVVVSTEAQVGTVEIHAWCSARVGAQTSPTEIRGHLADRIPGYMMPDAIHLLDVLPRTRRDKIDRSALIARSQQGNRRSPWTTHSPTS
jgi:amino acid adenylation domain-containing protein